MARHSFRIGKAQKRKKRRKQEHFYRKHGYPSEREDRTEDSQVFDEGEAFLSLAYLAAIMRKGGKK